VPALGRTQTSDCSNPELDLYVAIDGVLADVAQLEFAIFEKVTTGDPVQVYPETGRQSVVVGELCPVGEKLGTGHYVATYTVPDTEPIGTHEIRWWFKVTPLSIEQMFREEFEVLHEAVPSGQVGYCFVSDLRAEGVPESDFSDSRCARAISLASREIDRLTGRFFAPRELEVTRDGEGGAMLFFEHPIIAVEEMRIDDETSDLLDFVVYNRHVTQNLTDPDDRSNPKIEVLQARPDTVYWDRVYGRRVFPRGQQNIFVKGVFGFTEYDGTSQGRTPEEIRYVATLLSMRYLRPAWESEDETSGVGPVQSIKTRDQQITYANPANLGRQGVGPLTGDPAIDRVLLAHRRPIRLGFI